MEQISTKTPGQAWIKTCRFVMEKGHEIKDEDLILKEIIGLYLSVEEPTSFDEIMEKYANRKEMEWMRRLWLETKPIPAMGRFPEYKISYGKRLFDANGKDQIKWVIEKLKRNPETKSATISLLIPGEEKKTSITCAPAFDFKIRDGKLILTVFIRSQDAYKKLHFDILFVGKIAEIVADEVGVSSGPLNSFIVSEHIYETDFKEVGELLKPYKP